jgi:hypothetical protein
MTTTEFQTHPIFQKNEQLLIRINEQEVKEKLELDKFDFFKIASQFISDRLKVTIPTLLPITELNAVSTEIENALVQINNFIGNKNLGHITNAVNNINSALTYSKNLPIPYSKGDLDFSKIITQFQKTVEDKLIQIEKQREEVESKIETLKQDLETKQKDLNQLTTKISTKEKELETISTNFQTQFDNANTAFTKLVSDDRILFRTEIDTDREKIKNDTDGIIKDLERKLKDANKLVNVIGNVGVTGNYQIIANEHKITADNWRKIATVFMCILSGLLIFSIWKIGDVDYDWHKAIIRIIASAILIYPATYASRESGKHRKLENLNRKLELELSSISPFIEILEDSKKQEIKAKLVEKYFGNNNYNEDDIEKNENISTNMLDSITKLFSSVMKK